MFFHSLFPKNCGSAAGGPTVHLATTDRIVLVANKAVLAAHSSYFQQHLSVGPVDLHQLTHIAATDLIPVLRCLEHGCLFLHRGNVLRVLLTATRLGVPAIEAACYMYVKERMEPRDVMDIFQFAQMENLARLADLVRNFVFDNFDVVSQRRELQEAPEELLTHLFRDIRERVNDRSLAEFFERCCSGRGRQPSEDLGEAMGKKGKKMKSQWSTPPEDEKMKQFLADRVIASVVFVLGGVNAAARLVSVYNPAVNVWTHLPTLLPFPWSNMAAVYRKGCIFVLGGDSEPGAAGQRDFCQVARLNLASLRWRQLANLQEEHYNLAAVLFNDQIYAIGGADRDMDPVETVERYVGTEDRWEEVTSMPDCRTECGAVTSLNRIYVIGGYDSSDSLDSVIEYDPDSETWQPWPDMPVPLSSVRAALVGRRIFVAGGNQPDRGMEGPVNSCYCLDLEAREWSVCTSMEAARQFHCVVALNGRVIVLGSEPSVESFNPADNTWTLLGHSQLDRTNSAACIVPMDALGPQLTGLLESAWMGHA